MQFATAGSELGGPRTIVGVQVTSVGSDMGSITPMLADIKARTGKLPEALLADAGHAKHACIETAMKQGVALCMSVPKREQGAEAPVSEEVTAWREFMKTDQAKRMYHARAGLCELSTAHAKQHRGMSKLSVRGLANVTSVVLLGAITANILAHATAWLA